MADDETGAEPEGTEARVTKLEDEQARQGGILDNILAAVNKLVPGSHAEAQQREEAHLDRPSAVAEATRAEIDAALDAREREAAERQERDANKTAREELAELRASIAEKPPQPPRPRREALLGWRRDDQ